MKRILCLIMTLCMLLASITVLAGESQFESISYDELPEEQRAAFEAEKAAALANAKARAPKADDLMVEDRAGFSGYLGNLSDGSLSVEYVVSDSMVTIGEKVTFEVDFRCSRAPMYIIVGGVIMDENFASTGEIARREYTSSYTSASNTWAYTPSKAGYFCFVMVVSDYYGNMVSFSTNTVKVSRSYENPNFSNLAIDGNLSMKVALNKNTVNVGETITATVTFICDVNPVTYAAGWLLYDAAGNELDESQWSNTVNATSGTILNFSYTPKQAGEVWFLIVASDREGNEVSMNTPRFPAKATNTVSVSLNKSSVSFGSTVTANYNVQWTGAAPELEGCWCVETDEHTYNFWEDLDGLSGTSTYKPEFGKRARFFVRAKGSSNTVEQYSSYVTFTGTPLCADPVHVPSAKINQSSATIGSPITATYEIDNFDGKGYYYAEWQVIADGRNYVYDVDEPGLSGTVSFTPEFGDQVRFYVYAENEDGYNYFYRTGYINIYGTDKYTPPQISLKFDKSSIKTGETVTATYSVTGGPTGMEADLLWLIWDEDGTIIDSRLETVSGTGTSSISVPYGKELECVLQSTSIANLFMYESKSIPITGEPLYQPLKIEASLNKTSVKSGSPISVTYKVTGGFEPYDVTMQAYTYTHYGDGYWQVGNRFDLPKSGTETFVPYLGDRFGMYITAKDSKGNEFTWYPSSDVTVTGAPTPGNVSLSVTTDKREVHIGEPITATYSFNPGGAELGEGSWYVWYLYVDGGDEYVELESGSITELNGTLTYTPKDWAGQTLRLQVYCRNVYGQEELWYDGVATILEKPKVRIPGDADDNGSVTAADAMLILRYGAGESIGINLANADVNSDGQVDISDALLLFQKEAGWSVSLQ